ncbi:hypothetical protein ANANG_G00068350 [Anguilla anguilla]|uniref:Synaptopodin n=1 Tax=Anguilla anguilla TaxID=7936 RepID=A0A9D3S7M0_ANGAN|nr:hypothetical protein ANANG_G00068350 [Anguilla anguilla]
MEEGHQLVRCGIAGAGPTTLGRSLSLQGRQGPPAMRSDPLWKDRARGEGQDSRVAMVKPAVITGTTQTNRKTGLTRSVSLSDKELREARDRSQIIAAQLTFQSNANSRGVQLFNRRKQRVNAFTRTSYGQGVGQEGDGQLRQPVKWEEKHTERGDSQSDCRNSEPDPANLPGVVKEGGERMEEERGEPVPLEGPPAACVEEEGEQDLSGQCEVNEMPKEDTPHEDSTHEDTLHEDTPIEVASMEETPTESTHCEVKLCEDIVCTATPPEVTPPEATPPDDIRTAAVQANVGEKEEVVAPGKITNGCHIPPNTARVTLSLAKQAPAIVNRTARPFGATAVRTPLGPQAHLHPELLGNRQRTMSPIKSGILEEGKARRATRKSMFTFQEKPKVAPNPELLSLVQGVDQRKKGSSLPEPTQEEELLALGAEASNFLPKGGDVGGAALEETAAPEWSSCLKSSGARVRQEPKAEQAKAEQGLTNASGKGAELFARRQSRMDRTKAPPARSAKPRPKAPVPPRPESPILENGCTKLEMEISRHQPYQLNSSLFILTPTRDPMSSLPKAAPPPKPVLDRAHGRQTSLPASNPLPSPLTSPPLPPSAPSPRSERARPIRRPGARPTFSAKKAGLEPQTRRESLPTPTTPTRTTPVPTATPTLLQQLRRFSSPEALAGGLKFRPASPVPPPSSSSSRSLHPSSFSSPLSPSQEARCQSPLAGPDAKANRRLLAQNIINAAKRKNSPSPGGQNGRAACLSPFQPRPLGSHSPTFTSPPPTPTRSMRSPVRLYATRSLTDSDASLESEDSGLRSPGLRSYNTCPRGWGGSLRIKRGSISADL